MGRWGNREKLIGSDFLYVAGLFLAAVVLYTWGLGDLSLRDWDEGIIAGVARNIWRAEPHSQTWLYPTINYGDPYWNKPPLIHWAIALSYKLFGISEWSTRIFPALISACSIPLLYLIGREVFVSRSTALISASVYLTLLPVVRHGRLAMLDGAISCWFCGVVWCLLRGRKNRRWLLGTGLALGAICLTKGIMMGVLLGGIIILFLAWDDPKLLKSLYLWSSFALGILPAIAWYTAQYLHYGEQFLGISLGTQTFNRIWEPVSNASSPFWYYLLEIAKYAFPWLIFLPSGVKLAFNNYHLSWSKLALTWSGVYLLTVSLMATKLPWYIIPIYPGLSLLVGASLDRAWQKNLASYFWQVSLSLLSLICWLGTIYYGLVSDVPGIDLALILGTIALSFTLASVLLWLSSRYFVPTVIIGFYLALLLLFNSSHWLWELNEAFPVKPVAQILQRATPSEQKIYTTYHSLRPSLEFYSDRTVIPASDDQLQQSWQQERLYLLTERNAINRLNLQPYRKLGGDLDNVSWLLITQDTVGE